MKVGVGVGFQVKGVVDYNQPPGGNRDSQLIYTAKTSGDYYIDAASHKELTSGAYTLSYKVI